ncbi:hypothetical protein [Streptomyces sp. NPDC001933]|uniref:hypothetical protein n=1 Tax=Streptomyces sp. NPDC001933 TaxID=3364626 RepID=UPI0036771E02
MGTGPGGEPARREARPRRLRRPDHRQRRPPLRRLGRPGHHRRCPQDDINGAAFTTSKVAGTESYLLQPAAVAGPGKGVSLAYTAQDGTAAYASLT